MMRRAVKWLVTGLVGLSLVFGMAIVAFPGSRVMAADVKLRVRADRDDAAKAIFIGALADYFDVDTKIVLDLSNECDDESMVHAFYRSGETGRPVRRVMRDERRDYVKNRNSYIRFISEYYNVSQQKVRRWLNQGLTPREIVVGLDIADEYDVDADDVINMRTNGQSWDRIRRTCEDRYNRRRRGHGKGSYGHGEGRRGHRHGQGYRRGPRYDKRIIINFK